MIPIPPSIAAFLAKPLIKYGVPVAGIALLMLAVWVQGVRMHSWKVQAGAYQQTIALMEQKSKEAGERQKAVLQAQEDKWRTQAVQKDKDHEIQLADVRTATDRFIAANRVRTAPDRSAGSGSLAAAEGERAGLPAKMPADLVMVAASDVQVCGDLYAYGLAAHDWALSLSGSK